MQSRFAVLCCACASFWLTPAAAQQPAAGHPADPRAAVPAPAYASALAGYRPFREEQPASWRAVNDEVGRLGGHLGIFGGAGHAGHAPAKPSTTPPPAAPKPQQAPQSMHGKGHQGMMK